MLAIESQKATEESENKFFNWKTKMSTSWIQILPMVITTNKQISYKFIMAGSLVTMLVDLLGIWKVNLLWSISHLFFPIFWLAIQIIDELLTRHVDGKLHEGVSIAKLKKLTRCMRLLENVSCHICYSVLMILLDYPMIH